MSNKTDANSTMPGLSKEVEIFDFSSLYDKETLCNLNSIHCKRCGSKVMLKGVAKLTTDRKVWYFSEYRIKGHLKVDLQFARVGRISNKTQYWVHDANAATK